GEPFFITLLEQGSKRSREKSLSGRKDQEANSTFRCDRKLIACMARFVPPPPLRVGVQGLFPPDQFFFPGGFYLTDNFIYRARLQKVLVSAQLHNLYSRIDAGMT